MRSILAVIFNIVFLISCSYDDEVHCIDDDEVADVTAIDAPETATVNETVEVAVSFEVKNTCGQFGDFNVSTSENTRTIAVQAKYDGCSCAEVLTIRNTTYTFTPATSEDYILRFRSAPDNFLQATISVTEEPSEED